MNRETTPGSIKLFGLFIWRALWLAFSGSSVDQSEATFWLSSLAASFILFDLKFWEEVLKPTFSRIRGKRQKKRPTVEVDARHGLQAIDAYYDGFRAEDVSLYQYHFNRIIRRVDLSNYTLWSQSKACNEEQLAADEKWTCEYLMAIQGEGVDGAILQNMVNQYYFADVLQREREKSGWIMRVLYRQSTDFFPDATRTRLVMGLVSQDRSTRRQNS